jgi:hypothetical protein
MWGILNKLMGIGFIILLIYIVWKIFCSVEEDAIGISSPG